MPIGIFPIFDKQFDAVFAPEHGEVLMNNINAIEAIASKSGLPTFESMHAYAHVAIPSDFTGDPDTIYAEHEPRLVPAGHGVKATTSLIEAIRRDAEGTASHWPQEVLDS